jgi:hypothetical protein
LTVLDLGLDHPGGGPMHEVADLELGRAEEMPIGLGGEQLGHPADLVLGGPEALLGEDLGALLLLGSQVGRRHEAVRVYK